LRQLHHPNRDEILLSSVLYALSDPARLHIVMRLHDQDELPCNACSDLEIAKSTFSHHFKTLREAGVICTRMEGRQRFISLRKEDLNARFPGLMESILQAAAEGKASH
jgi:DNA-binding transcriptional ArsR family regulator